MPTSVSVCWCVLVCACVYNNALNSHNSARWLNLHHHQNASLRTSGGNRRICVCRAQFYCCFCVFFTFVQGTTTLHTPTSSLALPRLSLSAATCRLLQVISRVACGVRFTFSHLGTGDRIEFNKSQIYGAFKDEKCLIFPADFKVALLFEPDKSRFDLVGLWLTRA